MNLSHRDSFERAEFRETAAEFMKENPTESEQALYDLLDELGPGWEHQVSIEVCGRGEILDAYRDLRNGRGLAIEVDGSMHKRRSDERRDRKLQSMGIRTLRFRNRQVLEEREMVKQKIREALR